MSKEKETTIYVVSVISFLSLLQVSFDAARLEYDVDIITFRKICPCFCVLKQNFVYPVTLSESFQKAEVLQFYVRKRD